MDNANEFQGTLEHVAEVLDMCVWVFHRLEEGAGCVLCARSAGCSQKRLVFSFQGRNRIRNVRLLLGSRNQIAVHPLEEPVHCIAEKAGQKMSNINILNEREPFIRQVETLLP